MLRRRESIGLVVARIIAWAVTIVSRPGLWLQTVTTSRSNNTILGKHRAGKGCGKENSEAQYSRLCHWLLLNVIANVWQGTRADPGGFGFGAGKRFN